MSIGDTMEKPKPKKASAKAFKTIKKSEFRKTPPSAYKPSMYEIGKGMVAPEDMKRTVDEGSKRGGKFISFVKSKVKGIGRSIHNALVEPDADDDLRVGKQLNDYFDTRRSDLEKKSQTKELSKEEQQFLDNEYARDERIKKRGK